MIVEGQSDLENTIGRVFPVCDKPYHTNKRKVQIREEIEVLQNCALSLFTCKLQCFQILSNLNIGLEFVLVLKCAQVT